MVGLNPTLLFEAAMRTTQQFSITLPNKMAEAIRAKIADGEYATESEVIRDGLRALFERDRAVEQWLREQVVPTAEELAANSDRALTGAQVREYLVQKRRARSA